MAFQRSLFTGKERDSESGNDYFGARYYSSLAGRFLTPDWSAKVEPVPYAKMDDPQSLNLYAYVDNNPLSRIDADGHCGASDPNVCTNPGSTPTSGSDLIAQRQQQIDQQAAHNSAQQQTSNTEEAQNNPPTLDKNKTANYMDQHAGKASTERCAAYCRKGLEAGGLDTSGHPVDAGDYGPFLLKKGASAVSPDGYKPAKGDVAVFSKNQSHRYGHIEIFDGKQWVSDFKQNNFSPYRSNTPPVTVYRFPDN